MKEWLLSPEALADLELIWEFVATESETAANHIIDRMLDALDMLAKWPGAGHTRLDLTDRNVRF
jgi:plasmid stabilization system protein ParE